MKLINIYTAPISEFLLERYQSGRDKYGTIMQGNPYQQGLEEIADLYYYIYYIYSPTKNITIEEVMEDFTSALPKFVPQKTHLFLTSLFRILWVNSRKHEIRKSWILYCEEENETHPGEVFYFEHTRYRLSEGCAYCFPEGVDLEDYLVALEEFGEKE